MGRFSSPRPPQQYDRDRAPGLGGRSNDLDDVSRGGPAGPLRAIDLETATREGGFTGIVSRSRFGAVLPWPSIGHGGQTTGFEPVDDGPDPAAGETQFERTPSIVDRFLRTVRRAGLGTDDIPLAREGKLLYVRDRVPVAIVGTRLTDPIRVSDSGPLPVAKLNRRFTLRREFQQDAQTFDGLHQGFDHRAPGSRSPVRMLPARQSRLTVRTLPASFGQTTEVLNAGS